MIYLNTLKQDLKHEIIYYFKFLFIPLHAIFHKNDF